MQFSLSAHGSKVVKSSFFKHVDLDVVSAIPSSSVKSNGNQLGPPKEKRKRKTEKLKRKKKKSKFHITELEQYIGKLYYTYGCADREGPVSGQRGGGLTHGLNISHVQKTH